jgi:hypothetical protein
MTALLPKEMRTQPMVPVSTSVSRQRSERRIAVHLPLKLRGRDKNGILFEEETSSENLCRNGAAFMTRFDVAIGSDLEIRIPLSYNASRRAARPAGGRGNDGFAAGNAGRYAGARNYDRFAAARDNETDFATQGRVVHVADAESRGEKLVGVQFTGPRFQRVFRSESAA